MDFKVKGIVISSKDSKDKDKVVSLFCLDRGLLSVKLKSVKSPKAKMKIFKEPFCFADFVLAEKNGFYTVTSADLIDSFYTIASDYEKFLEASEILKVVRQVALVNQENNALFIATLKSLKTLAYDSVQKNLVLIKFLLNLFYSEGYEFSHFTCTNCKQKLGENRFLNLDTGEVLCASCKNDFCERISFVQSGILRIINQTDYDKLKTLKLDLVNLENVLDILKKRYSRI